MQQGKQVMRRQCAGQQGHMQMSLVQVGSMGTGLTMADSEQNRMLMMHAERVRNESYQMHMASGQRGRVMERRK